jgi:hypothetical protein
MKGIRMLRVPGKYPAIIFFCPFQISGLMMGDPFF